jgi:hypothetical protein
MNNIDIEIYCHLLILNFNEKNSMNKTGLKQKIVNSISDLVRMEIKSNVGEYDIFYIRNLIKLNENKSDKIERKLIKTEVADDVIDKEKLYVRLKFLFVVFCKLILMKIREFRNNSIKHNNFE